MAEVEPVADTERDNLGRPTAYTADYGVLICELLSQGQSLNRICKENNIPSRASIYRWLLSENRLHDEFRDNYALARKIGYECMADDIMDIADDGVNDWMDNNNKDSPGYIINGEALGRSRLRVDTRKWFMSKVLPKFADKEQEKGTDDMASVLQSLIDRLPN